MPTQKRRVIYMSDEDWAKAQEEAARYGQTISAYFRGLVVGGRVIPISVRDAIEPLGRAPAETDHVNPLRAIRQAESSFNSRGSKPVPKHR
jgi:hypothetical protein